MKFINPYSFVALRPSIKRDSLESDEKKYTGVIEYSLLTKTPLIIPNTSNDDAFKCGVEDHRSYDFFSYTDLSGKSGSCEGEFCRPVIPGSEIRGMLRSYFEILTNSCLSMVDEQKVLAKRTNAVFKAGLIKRESDNKYTLYEAIDHLMRTYGADNLTDKHPYDKAANDYLRKTYIQTKIPEGSRVAFTKVNRGSKCKPLATHVKVSNTGNGYIIKGAEGPVIDSRDPDKLKQQKHCAHIFEPTGRKVLDTLDIDILKTALDQYKIAMSYSRATVYTYEEYKRCLEEFMRGNGNDYFPVYYSKISDKDTKVMLSPAAITREIYQHRLGDILKSHAPCKKVDLLCPSCRLFGTVRDSFAVSSRIRFSDLEFMSDQPLNKGVERITTLPELSSPKLSNIEFYVKRPDNKAWFWTYDYYVVNGVAIQSMAEINGRKVYWHHKTLKVNSDEPKGNRNMTVRPLKKDQKFSGKLYFTDVTGTELNYLIYLLNAGEDGSIPVSKMRHGYKLGAAKPIGYGSIALKVDDVKIRTIDLSDEEETILYQELPYEDYAEPEMSDEIKKDFAKITSFDAVSDERVLRYPIKDNQNPGEEVLVYEWFVANHCGYDTRKGRTVNMPNSREQMVYKQYMKPLEIELASTGFGNKSSR